MNWSLDSTVFAPATVSQPADRAIVRISGPQVRAVMETLFRPDHPYTLSDLRRGALPGTITLDDATLTIRAWAWVFSAPNSYTGQDMVELHVAGCPAVLRLIDHDLIALGLVPAQRGEFTARAMLLGKIERTQAEAVNALVRADNDVQIQAALAILNGRLNETLNEVYDQLTQLVAAVEANIDFSEDQIEIVSPDQLHDQLCELTARIDRVIENALDAETADDLPRVFLVGPANAGKSSLLNALTGIDRAICSHHPGTTRDMLAAVWRVGDSEVTLVDTAGPVAGDQDALTVRALERTENHLPTADLYLAVFDLSVPVNDQIDWFTSWSIPAARTVAIANKSDLVDHACKEEFAGEIANRFHPPLFTSAITRDGLSRLGTAVVDRLGRHGPNLAQEQLALNRRQRHALYQARQSLSEGCTDMQTMADASRGQFGYEIIASDLRGALNAVCELLGRDATDNVLDAIFSQFCIGK